MSTAQKELADRVLHLLFDNITDRQDLVSVLAKALRGTGFSYVPSDAFAFVWFASEIHPNHQDYAYLRDAWQPHSVLVTMSNDPAMAVTGQEEFVYAYPCDEFCDRFEEYINKHYYPKHREMRDIVDPLIAQLRDAMPDPGVIPDGATYEDKVNHVLDEWLTGLGESRPDQSSALPEWLDSNAKGQDPMLSNNAKACFPWTPDSPQYSVHPSLPGTVLLIAVGQSSRLIREGEQFEAVIPGHQFCDMVAAWLEANWYPDHPDLRHEVESSLNTLRQALSTP